MHAHAEPVITTEEAQAVFELWARRKQELEALRQLPTSADLAEAMGVTTTEVEALLDEVRRSRVVTPPPVLPHRRRRKGLIIAVAVAGGFVLAMGMGFMMGEESARNRWRPMFPSGYAQAQMQRLPEGLRAEYRGYTLIGEEKGHWDVASLETNLLRSLESVVERMTPRPLNGRSSPPVDEASLIRALRGNEAPNELSNVLAFEPITVSLGEKSMKVFIPIALSSDYQLTSLVEAERARRLQVAANQAARLVAEARAAKPEAAPLPR